MQRRQFFNKIAEIAPNTFIGGVGATSVTSAADIAAVSTLTVADIQNFQIDVNNNVSFYVEVNYYFTGTIFYNDSAITYYLDLDGFCTGFYVINNLRTCVNLLYIKCENGNLSNGTGGRFVNNNTNLKRISNTNTAGIGFAVLDNADIEKLYAPNAVSVHQANNRAGLLNLTSLKRLYLPSCTKYNTAYGAIISLANIGTGCTVYAHASMATIQKAIGTITLNGSIAISDTVTINGLVYTCVASGAVEGEFNYNADARNIATNLTNAINADTRTGTLGDMSAYSPVSDPNVYIGTDVVGASGNTIGYSSASSGIVCAGATLSGGGGMDYTLKHIQDDKSGTIVFVGSPISVDPPTSLSATNQTTTSVDLTFTAPTPNANGTDAYEVWVDDGTIYRREFEYAEISASGDTLDLTEVYNDVGTISGAKIKIRTIDGEYNFSAFSNEITLP